MIRQKPSDPIVSDRGLLFFHPSSLANLIDGQVIQVQHKIYSSGFSQSTLKNSLMNAPLSWSLSWSLSWINLVASLLEIPLFIRFSMRCSSDAVTRTWRAHIRKNAERCDSPDQEKINSSQRQEAPIL